MHRNRGKCALAWRMGAFIFLLTGALSATTEAGDAAGGMPRVIPRARVDLPSIRILRAHLPPSQYHIVQPSVAVEGHYYRFRVKCNHATYEATSIRELLRLTHEIDVVEHFRRTNDDPQFWKGAGQSVAEIPQGVGRIVRHPGQSIQAITRGAARLTRGAGRTAGRLFGGTPPASDGNHYDAPGGGLLGRERRRIAHELGLDVYTHNPHISEFLTDMARARVAGRLPIELGLLAVPGSGVLSLSLTPVGLDDDAEMLIRDNDPDELRRENALRYEKDLLLAWDAPESATRALLLNRNFTPRQQTYLRHGFTRLGTVSSLENALRKVGSVTAPESALFFCDQIELLAAIHVQVHRLRRFVPVGDMLGAVTTTNDLVVAVPYDYAHENDPACIKWLADMQHAREVTRTRRAIAFFSGDIAPDFADAIKDANIIPMENFLLDPRIAGSTKDAASGRAGTNRR